MNRPLVLLALCALACEGRGMRMDRDAGADDASAQTDAGVDCSDDTFEACVYPSRGLAVTNTPLAEAEAIHVMDPITGRDLPLVAWIPDGDGPFPVVVFSHGGGFVTGHAESRTWGRELAAHGYVSIHYGSIEPDATALAAWCDLTGVPTDECDGSLDNEAISQVGRARDIIAVLESLDELSEASVARGNAALDLDHIAIAGWSGGARASMPVMGATMVLSPSVTRVAIPHPMPDAVVLLSPTGPGFGGYFDDGTETSWDEMRGPSLMVTGANDIKPDNQELTGPIRRFPFEAQPGDGARHLLYSTLDHPEFGHGIYNLGELGSTDVTLRRLSLAISSAVRAFLDAYVLGDEDAMAYLASDDARVLAGPADWLAR
jgi:dienelactone hydrolase